MTDLVYFPIKNGKPAFAPTLDTVRNHRFPGSLWQQGIISRDKEPDSGSKEFLAVDHFADFIAKDVMESKEDRHLYELVTERTCVRPYFDLEWDAGDDFEAEITMLTAAIDAIALALHNAGFIGRGLCIYTASGPCTSMPSGRKASYHVLCDTVQVFRNTKHHKVFVDQYLMPHADELFYMTRHGDRKCVIDDVPYTAAQSFRLPYQSKWKSAGVRRLVPFEIPMYAYNKAKISTIGVYENVEAPLEFAASEVRQKVAVVGRPSLEFPKVEPLCALLSDEFLRGYATAQHLVYCMWGIEATDRMCTLIHDVCRRAPNYEHAWVQGLIRSCTYSAFGIGSLVLWATGCSDKERVGAVLRQHTVRYHAELFEATRPERETVIHQRYVGRLAFEGDTLLLHSALGTGKTVAITQLIRRGGYERILIVSPRKSYTYSQVGVFQADRTLPALQCYLDVVGSLSSVDYLIVQAESLHRLSTNVVPYDLVIMDESESILCQMHSVVTHGKNMIANHEVLQRVVVSARHVLFADAFMSDRTFHMARTLRMSPHMIRNTFQPYERQAILLPSVERDVRVANLGGLCERIMAALGAGRRIVVVWTSRRRGEWFVEHFLKGAYTYLFYNSASTAEEQAGLRDVSVAWREVQCLMMTTSITVGISYDVGEHLHFDEAFLYASSASALPRDIAQCLLRVRVLKANRLTYVLDTRAGRNSVLGFASVWSQMSAKEKKQEADHPLVAWKMCPLWVRYNHCYNVNEERISRAEYRVVLQQYLVDSGYALREETHVPAAALAALPVELGNEGGLWDNIEDVSWDAADEILATMRRGEAMAEEIMSYKKWSFRAQFAGATEEELKGWWERFYESGREAAFWNVVWEKRLSITDVASNEAEARYGIMTTAHISKRQTLARFLGILGMNHSQEVVVLDAERLAALGEPLQAVEREIREGMGLRASRKKGDWGISHTMDLISIVLDDWGAVKVESHVKCTTKNKKSTRVYSLHISGNELMWGKITNQYVNYDENLIRL